MMVCIEYRTYCWQVLLEPYRKVTINDDYPYSGEMYPITDWFLPVNLVTANGSCDFPVQISQITKWKQAKQPNGIKPNNQINIDLSFYLWEKGLPLQYIQLTSRSVKLSQKC